MPWRSQVAIYARRPHSKCWRTDTHTRSHTEDKRHRERERGRICLIVWPTLTDGCALPKEQCDWENGPSVTLAVCVFVCVLMHVRQCYKSKCYTSIVTVPDSPDSNQAGRTVNSRSGLNNRHQSGLNATRRKPLHTSMPASFPAKTLLPASPLSISFFFYSLFDSPETPSRHWSLFFSSHPQPGL